MRWVSVVARIAAVSVSLQLAHAEDRLPAPRPKPDPLKFIYEGGDAERHCKPLAEWYEAGMKGSAPATAAPCSKWLQIATARYCADFDTTRTPRLIRTFLNLRRNGMFDGAFDPDALRLTLIGQGCEKNTDYELSNSIKRQPNVSLGFARLMNEGGEHKIAAFYLRPLAADGNAVAQHNLGVLLSTGRGGIQDYDGAQGFFRMAASKGYAPSMYSLAIVFTKGEGVKPDPVEAYKWLELAHRALQKPGVADEPGLRETVENGRAKLKEALPSQAVEAAMWRADHWQDESPGKAAATRTLSELKNLNRFNELCQPYANIDANIRQVDELFQKEAIEEKGTLVACITMIEAGRMEKNCTDRLPVISEILFYTKGFGLDEKIASGVPADGAVKTALVVGGYCTPLAPQEKETLAVFERMRKAYQERTPIKLAKAEPADVAPPLSSLSVTLPAPNASAADAPLSGRDFLASWRSRIGQHVTLGPCTLSPPGPSGIQCTFYNGAKEVGVVMLLGGNSIDPGSEFWARENCEKPTSPTTCTVEVSGVVTATEMGATLTQGKIRHDIAPVPAPVAVEPTVPAPPPVEKSDAERRREILPFVRAASDCVARAVAGDENRAAALQSLQWASSKTGGQIGPVHQCLFAINDMITAHDRIYGAGTGQAFYEGAYLKDLPRAVATRLGR
ncbi:tetratricopeptide repeat protein [Methylobacterium nigriterrae]|uniref:tetratricopeptide repeat protein n=1 Tax=Methylobacterium nigriterrae TaxID=3127512 RepID=UPI0030132074